MEKESSQKKPPKCPKCSSVANVIKNGHVSKNQRWRCKTCKHDFVLKKIEREPKFKYSDLKILSVFLYYVGLKPEDIFKKIVKLTKNNLTTEKVIYQWTKQISRYNKSEVDFKFKAKSQIVGVHNAKEHTQILNEFLNNFEKYVNRAYIIYFPIIDNMEKSKIHIFQNGIQDDSNNPFNTKPPWFILLLYMLRNCNQSAKILKLFAPNDIHLAQNLLERNNNYINYCYTNYFISVEEMTYDKLKMNAIEQQFSRVEVKSHCFLSFDTSFKDLNICIINRKSYATAGFERNSSGINNNLFKKRSVRY